MHPMITLNLKWSPTSRKYDHSVSRLIEGTLTKLVERSSSARPILPLQRYRVECVLQSQKGGSRSRQISSGIPFQWKFLTFVELDRNFYSMVTAWNIPHYLPSSRDSNLGWRIMGSNAEIPPSLRSTSRLFTQ